MRMHYFTRLLIGLLIGLFSTLSLASVDLSYSTGYTTPEKITLTIVLAPEQTPGCLPAEIADNKSTSFDNYKATLILAPGVKHATSDDSLLRYRTRYAAGFGGDSNPHWKPEEVGWQSQLT